MIPAPEPRPASRGHNIETFTGLFFDYDNPQAADVTIDDIARGLSHTCRYAGHTSVFYSVAEHAMLTTLIVIDAGHPELALAALHHDSHEAYIGDVPTPLKAVIGSRYAELAARIDEAIAKALGLDAEDFDHPVVRSADRQALCIEVAALKASQGITGAWTLPQPPPAAPERWAPGRPIRQTEANFLVAHEALCWLRDRNSLKAGLALQAPAPENGRRTGP